MQTTGMGCHVLHVSATRIGMTYWCVSGWNERGRLRTPVYVINLYRSLATRRNIYWALIEVQLIMFQRTVFSNVAIKQQALKKVARCRLTVGRCGTIRQHPSLYCRQPIRTALEKISSTFAPPSCYELHSCYIVWKKQESNKLETIMRTSCRLACHSWRLPWWDRLRPKFECTWTSPVGLCGYGNRDDAATPQVIPHATHVLGSLHSTVTVMLCAVLACGNTSLLPFWQSRASQRVRRAQ